MAMPTVHSQSFWRDRIPPHGTYVHISVRCIASAVAPIAQIKERNLENTIGLQLYKTVIALGNVLFQVIGFPEAEGVSGTEVLALGAAQIWPLGHALDWPGPLPSITAEEAADHGVILFHNGRSES
jgi:hypothetical protein